MGWQILGTSCAEYSRALEAAVVVCSVSTTVCDMTPSICSTVCDSPDQTLALPLYIAVDHACEVTIPLRLCPDYYQLIISHRCPQVLLIWITAIYEELHPTCPCTINPSHNCSPPLSKLQPG